MAEAEAENGDLKAELNAFDPKFFEVRAAAAGEGNQLSFFAVREVPAGSLRVAARGRGQESSLWGVGSEHQCFKFSDSGRTEKMLFQIARERAVMWTHCMHISWR